MFVPDDLFTSIAACVDKLNRGGAAAGSVDISQTIDLAHSVLEWTNSLTEQDIVRRSESKVCDAVSEKGKRLYLQAQTLRASGPLLAELRAVLLGLGSMLLARFKTGLPPALQAQLAVKLSSAAADLSAACGDRRGQAATAQCCTQTISILRQLDTLLLAQCMPSREIEHVQVAMMTEYLRAARLLLTMEEPPNALLLLGTSMSNDKSTIAREYINLAALSAQNINPLATVRLCEALLALAEELHTSVASEGQNPLEEAAYFLAFARERLELCISSTVAAPTAPPGQLAQAPPPSASSTRALRLNLAFSLAHASSQLGRYDKAFVLIEEAETELRAAESADEARSDADKWTLSFLVPYSKFHVRASQGNWAQARSYLLVVIHSHADVKLCLGLVRRYVEGNECSMEGQRELFQLCAQAFPNAPAHVEVLMARLQALLGISPATGVDNLQMKEALSLARELVAQQDGGNPLDESHVRTLRALLRSRVSYFLATGQWGLVEHWAGLLLRMLGADTDADYVITSPAVSCGGGSRIDSALAPSGSKDVLLLRAHARSQMGRHADAREDCEHAWTLEPGADTALAAFRSEMYDPAPTSQMAAQVTETQRKSTIERFLLHCDKLRADGTLSQSDELMLIARAARIARDTFANSSSDSRRCQRAFADLLRHWILRYEKSSAWRLEPADSSAITDEDKELVDAEPSLMRVASELLHCCLEEILLCYPPVPMLEGANKLPSLSGLSCSAGSDKENLTPPSSPMKRARPNSTEEEEKEINLLEPVAKKGPRRRLLSRHAMEEAEKLSQAENGSQHSETKDIPSSPTIQEEGNLTCSTAENASASASASASSIEHALLETELTPLPVQPSPVSFFHLPQCAGSDSTFLDRTSYAFQATLSSLQRDLVAPLQTTSRLISAARAENLQTRLGSFSEILWLADLAWNIANLFVHKKQCSIVDDTSLNHVPGPLTEVAEVASTFQATAQDSMRLLTAAHLFELAEGFYGTCLTYPDGQIHSLALSKNQHSCLLVGAACRLDANSLGGGAAGGGVAATKGLRAAATSARKALNMLASSAGFQDAVTQQLHRTSLLLLFTALCRGGECAEDACVDAEDAGHAPAQQPVAEFLAQQKEQLQNLSVSELLQLSSVAAAGPHCPASATYRLLTLAWEKSKEPPLPGEPLVRDCAISADIQCRLLLLAPSPAAALEHVRVLCDLCNEGAEAETAAEAEAGAEPKRVLPVRPDTMDQACSVAFNFGATLSETGQASLAEKFLAHAVAMLPHASLAFSSAWRGRMEKSYYALLQKLLPHRAHEAPPHGLASFGQKMPAAASVRGAR